MKIAAALGYAIAVILFAIIYRYIRWRRKNRELDRYKE